MKRIGLVLWISAIGLSQTHVEVDLVGERIEKSNIAVPDFALLERSGMYDEAWRTINEVLRNDLIYSGFFNVLSESRIRLIRSPHIGPIDFEEWGSIEAKHLVVGSIKNAEGRMNVEVRVFEVATKQHIIAKAFFTKPELARKTAHVIADEIMLHLRNIQFASSKIIYTRERSRTSGSSTCSAMARGPTSRSPIDVARTGAPRDRARPAPPAPVARDPARDLLDHARLGVGDSRQPPRPAPDMA